ncbi:MAG: lipid-binding protein [Adhaeribacter sp.]
MKINKLLILPLLLSFVFLTSCEKDDPEIDYMATYPVSGDWTVNYYVENDEGELEEVANHTQIIAYNTSANVPTEIWIDDHGSFWDYKVKTSLNMADLTFSGNELENEHYESKVTITDGKVIKNGTKVKGMQADSIYFRVSFDDEEEPYGTIYHAAGHRSNGFGD